MTGPTRNDKNSAQGFLGRKHTQTPPSQEEWGELEGAVGFDPRSVVVDVVVPVFRNLDETLRCLYSVKKSKVSTPFHLIVVDDCSPEPELSEALKRLADRGLFELHKSDENRGFVASCNFAMSLHPARDVVLLNSDTEVFGDWLDRLRRASASASRVATVTPLSNNAEICSYPRFAKNNTASMELSDDELDRLASVENAEKTLELPTGVGFCLYINRECLNEIGFFDEENFGSGYGEENDFCRRAAYAGWSNVLAADVFVRHHGGSSFGASKDARVRHAHATMERLHPGYLQIVGEFMRDDPMRPFREALDAARIRRMATRVGKTILYVTHSWGGGTERHVQDMAKLALAEDAVVLIGRAHPAANDIIQFTALADADFPNLPELRLRNGVDAGAAVLKALGVTHVHVQHLADLDPQVSDFVTSVCSLAGLAYDVTLHDYMSVCPRLTLIDGTGRYCGEPSEADCEACVQRYGSPFGKPLVWNWRARHERFLAAARMIFVPSEDQAARMARFSPRLEFVVRPHPESATQNDAKSVATRKKRKARRIGILGAIGPQKGSVLISEVVKVARIKQLDLEFAIIGYSDRDAELRSLGVEITGAFQEGEAPKLLQSQGVDLVWFASVCPETYSYALSDAIRAGVMPVAFDLGAIGERIRKSNWGHLLDLELMLAPEAIAEALATIRIQRLPAEVEIRRVYTKLFSSYYGLGMS